MPVRGVPLRVCLEDVIHHRQAEAAHQFTIELQVAVFHAVAQAMKILQQVAGLLIRQSDDWVLIQ